MDSEIVDAVLKIAADITGSSSAEREWGAVKRKGIIGKMYKFDGKMNICFREKKTVFPKLIFVICMKSKKNLLKNITKITVANKIHIDVQKLHEKNGLHLFFS